MNKERKELLELAERIKSNGFRVFVTVKEEYNWIVFACGIKRVFYTEGRDVSLQYKPSKENGSGCRVAEDFLSNIESVINDLKYKPLDELCFIPLKELTLYEDIEEYLKDESWTEYKEI